MTSGSEVMCRKKVDTPWSIYRFLYNSQPIRKDLDLLLRQGILD